MTDQADRIVRARSGDRAAFDALAASVVDRLYAVAKLILRDGDRAQDAVQETLVRCWRDLPMLREPERFEGWLRRLLMHAIADELRRDRRQRAAMSVLRLEPSSADGTAVVAVREQLDRGFARLSVDHRAVIVHRLYLGLSLEDTAAALGIPVGTAKSRLHYAVSAMRVAIEADGRATSREISA